MALLDGVVWEGKVFKGGAWADGRGGTYPVVEPATGNELFIVVTVLKAPVAPPPPSACVPAGQEAAAAFCWPGGTAVVADVTSE